MKAWKSRLFPLYEEMEVDYNKNPKTLIEVFDPLIKLFEI